MGLRSGYKQTEVGVIPEDWDLKYIENLAHITTGSRNTQDRVNDGLYPFFVRSQTIERINSYSFDGEAVLTAGDGVGTGKVFHYINGRFDTHQRVYRISEFNGLINGYFFFLYFSNHFYSRIMQMTAKSSVDSVRREMIARMPIPLPPKMAEQEAIAEALSDADALIESLEQLLAKKRHLKQGAMQELLPGKKRLPGFQSKPGYTQTEVGAIPADWAVTELSRVCSMKSGEGITSANIDEFSEYPCYGGNGLRGFTTRFTHEGRYALIGRQGALCGNVLGVKGEFFASEHAIVVTGSALIDIGWLTFVLGKMRLNRYTESSAQPGLSVSKVLALNLALPPTTEEQTAIAAVLTDMDAEIATLETKLTKARQLKTGMMQELLTGRIRLL